MTFYLIAGGIALVCAILIVRPLLRTRDDAPVHIDSDTQVFKDQLAEIDRDLARGTIRPEEAEGARIEVSRRLLAAAQRADRASGLGSAPQGLSGMIAGLTLIGTPALAAALYFGLGSPGLEDQPLAERTTAAQSMPNAPHPTNRMTQEEAEAQVAGNMPPAPDSPDDEEYATLVAQLEETVASRPDDAQGHQLLANGLMRLGRWPEAAASYQRVIEILGPNTPPEIYANQAEAYVLAAGGYVSPKAEAAIRRSLELDPTLAIGRYYAGLALRQSGRLDDAITIWEGLRQDSPPDAPYLEWLNMLLAETIQARGGVAPAIPGPSEDDIAAANEMSPEERAQMIEGMVARLDARLAEEGGSPNEWAQLVSSYAALGRMEQAREALKQALASYPTGPAARMLTDRAVQLGLVEAPAAQAAPAPGPTQQDIEAASQMSAGDRAAMIEGMVARLEDRLTNDGGTAEEWLRLINAYVQLDRKDDAARIYRLADVALEQDPSRGFVKEQALLLGVPVE